MMQSTRSRLWVLGLAAALFTTSACAKDEAAQTADWNRNVENVQKYAAKFPSFKSVFDQRVAEATKAFGDAKGISDPKARADAMGVANRQLNDLLPPFDAYEAASRTLTETLAKHSTMPAALSGVTATAKAAQTTASTNIAAAAPTNVGEAKAKVEAATAMLKDGTDLLASTGAYVVAQKALADLMVDKDILNLPAAKVNPAIDAAKAAQKTAAEQLAKANGATALEAKAAVAQATTTLNQAIEPLKALKPAPAATAANDKTDKNAKGATPAAPKAKKK